MEPRIGDKVYTLNRAQYVEAISSDGKMLTLTDPGLPFNRDQIERQQLTHFHGSWFTWKAYRALIDYCGAGTKEECTCGELG